jgi:hypothetical protein
VTTFTVRSSARPGPSTTATLPKSRRCVTCVLVATAGEVAGKPNSNRIAVAALSFGPRRLPFTGLPTAQIGLVGAMTLGAGIILVITSGRRRPDL